jgi:hypothetical protein
MNIFSFSFLFFSSYSSKQQSKFTYTKIETMTTKTNSHSFYSSMHNNDDHLFSDEQIQRYDADTIKHRYGDNWRNYASNIREIKQADGSIVRGKNRFYHKNYINIFFFSSEYIIDDPNLLEEIKPPLDSTSSTTGSEDEHQSSKHKFAQIKAKFEQRSFTNVMASPSSSSVASSNTTTTRPNSNRQTEDSNKNNRTNVNVPLAPPMPFNPSQRSQSSSNSSFRRLHSADEADEEVQRIHRQGEEFRQRQGTLTPISSINESTQPPPPSSNVEYEVVDEDGNPMAIDGVHDLIKMSGVTAREVPQPDGTIIREYVIDDPHILSKFQSQQSPTNSQQRTSNNNYIPPPPPRVPLKQPALFRQGPSNTNTNNNSLPNIQQIRVLEPQRRYEYITTAGKRIEFMVTNIGPNNQMTNDSDIQELSNAINTRLLPSGSNTTQQPFTLPKQWHPAVDLTHREEPTRQRTGSDNQPIPNNYNVGYQQPQPLPTDMARSASYGTPNQGSYQQQFAPVYTEPIIDWTALQQQDPHGQIDPQLVRQFITQKHQTGSFQSSAQFLPEQQQQQQQQQVTRSTNSPLRTNAPVFYQQQMPYPYQGQQQHGVRIFPNNNDYNLNQQQQQATMFVDGNTRI